MQFQSTYAVLCICTILRHRIFRTETNITNELFRSKFDQCFPKLPGHYRTLMSLLMHLAVLTPGVGRIYSPPVWPCLCNNAICDRLVSVSVLVKYLEYDTIRYITVSIVI